ncbi:hypothetical protein, partial [Salipiger pentaromativorans]
MAGTEHRAPSGQDRQGLGR